MKKFWEKYESVREKNPRRSLVQESLGSSRVGLGWGGSQAPPAGRYTVYYTHRHLWSNLAHFVWSDQLWVARKTKVTYLEKTKVISCNKQYTHQHLWSNAHFEPSLGDKSGWFWGDQRGEGSDTAIIVLYTHQCGALLILRWQKWCIFKWLQWHSLTSKRQKWCILRWQKWSTLSDRYGTFQGDKIKSS